MKMRTTIPAAISTALLLVATSGCCHKREAQLPPGALERIEAAAQKAEAAANRAADAARQASDSASRAERAASKAEAAFGKSVLK